MEFGGSNGTADIARAVLRAAVGEGDRRTAPVIRAMRSIETRNLEIPGLVLRTIPE